MSRDSFAAHLKSLGAAHTLPKPAPKKSKKKKAESGSSRQETEGTGTSSANPDPLLEVEDPELSADQLGVESPDLQPKLKKRKPSSSVRKVVEAGNVDLGKSPVEVLDLDVEGEEGTRVASGVGKPEFGRYSLKKVIGLMSELPSDQDWEVMEEEGLVENFKGLGSLWAELGGRLAGFNTHALNQLKKEREFSADSLTRISKLEKSLDLARSAKEVLETGMATRIKEAEARKEAELGQRAKDAEIRADETERKVAGLEEQVAELKKQLETRKAPADVISDFQKSPEYGDALSKAAAAEVMRCWTVAEKHLKTDPGANAQSFIDLYIAAKDQIAAGGPEPEPYVAPGQEVDSDSSAESEPVDEEIPVQDLLADDPSVQVPPPA
ncbi:uncharacterized protein LOC108198600 [Daucus carota subsp. sativus]|uniref:uncharacterized protein LOC108198600 n=1 Tax=Daucus carota subsp. sativus TaxID=79200 RepID=UPI003082A2A4